MDGKSLRNAAKRDVIASRASDAPGWLSARLPIGAPRRIRRGVSRGAAAIQPRVHHFCSPQWPRYQPVRLEHQKGAGHRGPAQPHPAPTPRNFEVAPTGDCPGMGHCDSSAQLGRHGEFFGADERTAEDAARCQRAGTDAGTDQAEPDESPGSIGRSARGFLLASAPLHCVSFAILWRRLQISSLLLELRVSKPSRAMAPAAARAGSQAARALPAIYARADSIRCRKPSKMPRIRVRARLAGRSRRARGVRQ